MTAYVEFAPRTGRELRKLSSVACRRVLEKIDFLAGNPLPHGYTEMKGSQSFYRLKVGDYRIIYTVEHGELMILVLTIGERREMYR